MKIRTTIMYIRICASCFTNKITIENVFSDKIFTTILVYQVLDIPSVFLP